MTKDCISAIDWHENPQSPRVSKVSNVIQECSIRLAVRQQLEGRSDMAQHTLTLIRAHYDFVKAADLRE